MDRPERFAMIVDPKIGDFVKIHRGHESFWLRVLSIDGSSIVAEVNNNLIDTESHGLVCGDVIRFGVDDVIAHKPGKKH